MLTIVGCSSDEEVTTTTNTQQATTQATTSDSAATTESTQETVSEAQPTPIQGGVVLNERQQSGGTSKSSGLNLDHEFGEVPPFVPTEPVKTLRKCSERLTCQPPRFPIEAALQT